MINKKQIYILLAVGIISGFSSCQKYLDVNTNPNYATTATVQQLLPAAELYLGTAVGVDMEIDGSFFAEYWTQNPGGSQYHSLDQYLPGADAFSTLWTNLYAANENFYQMYKVADSMHYRNYMAIALILQAYTFQLTTDAFGDVPFTQALKGQFIDGHLVNPKYDAQSDIYNGLIGYLNSADSLMKFNDVLAPGADDLIYGKSASVMTSWQKFSNTLRLKILLRLSYISPAMAQAGIDSFMKKSPAFIGTGDDAFIAYGFSSANKNPLYAEASSSTLGSTQNFVGSSTIIDSMNANSDPRLNVYYETTSGGTFVGLAQGLYFVTPAAGSISIPSKYVAGDAQNSGSTNAPVNFITSYESLFLQAEAAARGWGNATGSDATLFQNAIKASFEYYGSALTATTGVSADSNYNLYMATGGNWTQYPATGSVEQKVRYIITQKWFAMCGNQGFEAWTEQRRTGYPDFLTYSVSGPAGTQLPKRFLYPTSESNVNANYPGLQSLFTKVWWDIN
jgi:Starch-binding associating with outer membrane